MEDYKEKRKQYKEQKNNNNLQTEGNDGIGIVMTDNMMKVPAEEESKQKVVSTDLNKVQKKLTKDFAPLSS